MAEYPITLIVVEVVEAIVLVALVLMVIKIWREVEIPEGTV